MPISMQLLLLIPTIFFQAIATWLEDQESPPGQLIDIGDYQLHLCISGEAKAHPTIIFDHSLGGIEGYFLIEELSRLTRVCIYDRAGYGWSDHSPNPRTSEQIANELDTLLTQAKIEPPYILIGDSFGTYNVRMYTHLFPEKVLGIVLTDGLHEIGMLNMPLALKLLKLFFISGFFMSTLGSMLGIIRLLNVLKIFELLKPELRKFPQHSLKLVKRSFCRPKHWITMSREMINLEESARQVSVAKNFGEMPIMSIKASSFFKPSFLTLFIPLKKANKLRDRMHQELCKLSTNCTQIEANQSGHFVWVDEPHIIINAVKKLLAQIPE
ncbi:alpha/beta fold hydrolase [[Leptolyngbya] sp. PCC 7376]|uniref:alpha/beta fold hydrolase n=1 Tax=[Leptolyngbya] sp. PCC 7376 TaxID=111781 RepID=UPI00059FD5ED|nr:alpha/beta hydrolase [[Leptolyngbya] sp. PCC 7376]